MNGLKYIRTRCNLSLAEVAEHIGVSRQIISAWENGSRGISEENKEKLEAFFGISSQYFGEITEEEHNDILAMPMLHHQDGEKQYYTYQVSQDDDYVFLPEMGQSLDALFAEAIQRKKQALQDVERCIMEHHSENLFVLSKLILRESWYFEQMVRLIDNISAQPTGEMLPCRQELHRLMTILLAAFNLESEGSLREIENGVNYEESDREWAEGLYHSIRNHWQGKTAKHKKTRIKPVMGETPATGSTEVPDGYIELVRGRR